MKLRSKVNIIIAELEGCKDECKYSHEKEFIQDIIGQLKNKKFREE